jgi:hypothetical protein
MDVWKQIKGSFAKGRCYILSSQQSGWQGESWGSSIYVAEFHLYFTSMHLENLMILEMHLKATELCFQF